MSKKDFMGWIPVAVLVVNVIIVTPLSFIMNHYRNRINDAHSRVSSLKSELYNQISGCTPNEQHASDIGGLVERINKLDERIYEISR